MILTKQSWAWARAFSSAFFASLAMMASRISILSGADSSGKSGMLWVTLLKFSTKVVIELEYFANMGFSQYSRKALMNFAPIKESLDPLAFVVKRDVDGGTSARAMQTMLDEAHQHLEESVAWFGGIMAQQQAAKEKRKALIDQLLNT